MIQILFSLRACASTITSPGVAYSPRDEMLCTTTPQVLRSPVRRLSLNADEADDSSDHSFTVGSPRGRHVAQSRSPRGAASRSREHDASSPVSRTRVRVQPCKTGSITCGTSIPQYPGSFFKRTHPSKDDAVSRFSFCDA